MILKSQLIKIGLMLKTLHVWPMITATAMAIMLAGCSSSGDGMSGFGLSNMQWFNSAEPSTEESFNVGGDPENLGSSSNQEAALQNAIELAEQKRFLEARILLTEVRDIQDRESDGYRAISCAMAILALRDGDIRTFRRVARQLDTSLGNPVRVPPAYTEIVSLYRAMSNQSLPVNAPERIQQMRDRLLPSETASINEGSQ
jgi:hypothetical protein